MRDEAAEVLLLRESEGMVKWGFEIFFNNHHFVRANIMSPNKIYARKKFDSIRIR